MIPDITYRAVRTFVQLDLALKEQTRLARAAFLKGHYKAVLGHQKRANQTLIAMHQIACERAKVRAKIRKTVSKKS